MKAVFIERFGGNEVVRVDDQPTPEPGPTELLVQVHAAGVNPVDYKLRDGKMKVIVKPRFPLVLGSELSGVVVGVGAQVTRFRVGDEVFARLDKERIGAYAELAAVDESLAAPKPANLTHEEAASLPLVGLTSWQALVDVGRLQRGQKVLIHAGSGGIGTFAIQLAKHLGAHVATTASARNAGLVRSLGADEVIDYRSQAFEEVLSDYDLVYDTLAGETQHRSFAVLNRGGTLVSIAGNPDAAFAREHGLNPLLRLALAALSWKSTRLARRHGVRFAYHFMHPDGAQLAEIGRLVEAGAIRPVIDRTFPLERVAEAFDYSAAGRTVGKVVVQVRPSAQAVASA